MKSIKLKISIFMLIISALTCCLLSWNSVKTTVYAVDQIEQSCYCLLDNENNSYVSNVEVGTVSGGGNFVVGHENVLLKATAKTNFQLVGWQITYLEQASKTQFVDALNLEANKKEITLIDKDEKEFVAEVEFNKVNNVFTTGTFKLNTVFEDLKIIPVYDHVYYQVNVNSMFNVVDFENSLNIGENILYYSNSSTDGEVTTYTNSIIKIDENFFYYGTLYSKEGKYYTTHQTLQASPISLEVDYLKGAFRVGDNVNINFDVNIDAEDIKSSKNIDVVGVNIDNGALGLNNSNAVVLNSYKIEKDSLLRTTNFEINFNILNNANYVNVLDLVYHNLYVVSFNFLIDGEENSDEIADLFGDVTVAENEIRSNISVFNFYVKTKADNTEFLVKTSSQNQNKVLRISCATLVSKTIDGASYNYYVFDKINNSYNNVQDYSNIATNLDIVINYSSVKYEVSFSCLEQVNLTGVNSLVELNGNCLNSLLLKRGDKQTLDDVTVKDVENIGYEFIGYTNAIDGEITSTFDVEINKLKPEDKHIYLCFKKINYQIVLTNYNKVTLTSGYAIDTLTFEISDAIKTTKEVLNQTNLTETTYSLTHQIQLGQTVKISTKVNNGFNILGYSLVSEATEEDLMFEFVLDENFIVANNIDRTITLYVQEELIEYTLTYFTILEDDPNLNADVVMAEISVVNGTFGEVKKYNTSGVEISAENNNLTDLVAEIVVTKLHVGEVVELVSEGIYVANGDYTYIFNWFTEDDKSTLDFTKTENKYTHSATIRRDIEIKVVYAMPSAKVKISINEEFSTNENFSFEHELSQNGELLEEETANSNIYIVEIGVNVVISLKNISAGYIFKGYQIQGSSNFTEVDGTIFNYPAVAGVNDIVLIFDQINYNIVFSQYGAGFNGEKVLFDGNEFASVNVDNANLTIRKPLGYYVANVIVGENISIYSNDLSENNNYRTNADILTYNFALTREQLLEIIANYATTNAQGDYIIDIKLNYLIFKYEITLGYNLTNPKGDSRDDKVNYPTINLNYSFDGQSYQAKYTSVEKKEKTFIDIPYGAIASLSVVSAAPSGLTVVGWSYNNFSPIDQNDYTHSLSTLLVGEVNEDKHFVYNLSYIAYKLIVSYNSMQGNPYLYLNDINVSTQTQITLYDKIKVVPRATRTSGYQFKTYKYSKPVYKPYSYVDDETWQNDCLLLYVKVDDVFEKNSSVSYNENETYYVYSTEEVEIAGDVDNNFIEESFDVKNYAIYADNQIVITVEYDLIQLTISNKIMHYGEVPSWSLTGRGTSDARIEFNEKDLALFEVKATLQDGTIKDLIETDTVTFYDSITILIEINKNALNVDGVNYDLSLGLILSKIQVLGKTPGFETIGEGLYRITLNINKYIPNNGCDIEITYFLEIQKKTVTVTSVVQNSTEFYKNYKMFINASDYKFETSPVESVNKVMLPHGLQFLAKARVYSIFTSEEYNQNFKISGVSIYCMGKKLSKAEYTEFGIEVSENFMVYARLMYNFDIVFNIQPIITFNGGPYFAKYFECDNLGEPINQKLTVGSSSSYDIQVSQLILPCVKVEYLSTVPNSNPTESVASCGDYVVLISFENVNNYNWLNEIKIVEDVMLKINQKSIYLDYDVEKIQQTTKVYDGNSEISLSNLYKSFKIVDGKSLSISYEDIMINNNSNLKLENFKAFISTDGKDGETAYANEDVFYNIYVYDYNLRSSDYNNNFILENKDLIIKEYIKITKRPIELTGINVYDKVYDETTKAELIGGQNIVINNKISGDQISIDETRINVFFENAEVGNNKKVTIQANDALTGKDVANYYIEDIYISGATIYPYSVSCEVKGVGEIVIFNQRGLTEKENINLIPLNAVLSVSVIYPDSVEYSRLHNKIAKFAKGNNEFAIGYVIEMTVNGKKVEVNKGLMLSVPNVKNLTGLYFLTGDTVTKSSYSEQNGRIVIDMQNINTNLNTIFLTQKRILLKPWQIVLIIVLILLVIVAIILIFMIIRKRKIDRSSVYEKI